MSFDVPKTIIVILIASAFIIGTNAFAGDLFITYGTTGNVTADHSTETMEKINEMRTKLDSTSEATGIIDIMLNGVWKMFSVVLDVLDIFISLINDLAKSIGLESYANIFIGIITVIIVFGLVYLIMNLPR